MVMDRVLASKVTEGSVIQYKENRSQNRSMWDSTADKQWGRTTGFDKYSLRGKKRTGGEQYRVCQKYVQDFGEWYATVCQRKLIDQAKLEQIPFPGQESIEGFLKIVFSRAVSVLCPGL